ncbi:glycerophosphodiester phosphodiesterase family protein, partial [Heyndrickxia sp. NPDC080065]|uniref:glycerophosphodiester phosphodiesterase n=1 Tax=Heyndrickxia sp. NPDC080065 TaxID=3390568 RepID=UPI003D05A0D8
VQDGNNRFVTDTEKSNWNGKAGTAVATQTANGLMSKEDKTKLDGVETGANKYTHPATHPASIIVQDGNNRFVTDTEKSNWNGKAGTAVATQTANGLMSSIDKSKLDGVATGANNYVHPSNHPPSIITQDANNRFVSDAEKANWNAKETTAGAQSKTDKALADAKQWVKDLSGGIKFKDLKEPIYICHRGALNIFPENSLEAFQNCVSLGNPVIEMDAQKLQDNTLAIMHDDTVDRTTNGKGNVSDYNIMGWRNLKINTLAHVEGSNSQKASPGYSLVSPPLLEEVFRAIGNNAVYMPESKDKRSTAEIVALVKKYNLEEYVLIQSFDLDDLQPAIDVGIPTIYLHDSIPDPKAILARGVKIVGVSSSVSDSFITGLKNAGLKVYVYTINNRYIRDRFTALGVNGFFTNDPWYLSNTAPILRKDPFTNQQFTHGMIPSYTTYRGGFYSPNRWGWVNDNSDRDFVLAGWAGELPDKFKITFDFRFDRIVSGSWGSLALCTPIDYFDDNKTSLSNGYHILWGQAGTLDIYKCTNGTSTKIATTSSPSLSSGVDIKLEITIDATSVKIARADYPSYYAQVNDTAFRKGFLHFGRKQALCSWSNVVITPL